MRQREEDPERSKRVEISLACSECGARNYKTTKIPDKVVELKKFCRTCNRHTVHRETK